MRRILEFWFDFSMTFLWAVVAILVTWVELVSTFWHFRGTFLHFINFFTRPDVCAKFGDFLSMFRESNYGLNGVKINK